MFQLQSMATHVKTRVEQFKCTDAAFEIVEFQKGWLHVPRGPEN